RLAEQALIDAGFTVEARDHRGRRTGVTVSFLGLDSSGAPSWFDVCAPLTSHRGGMLRNDVVWRALGRAAAVRHRRDGVPFVLLTTHLPRRPSEGDTALRAAGPDTCFDVIGLFDEADIGRLARYAAGERTALPGF